MDIRTSRPNRPGPDLRIQGLSIGQRRGPPCAPFAPVFRRLVVQAYPHTINGFVLCILSLCATYVVHGRTTHPVLVSTHAAHCAHRIKRHRQNRAEIGSAISGHYRSRRLPAAGHARLSFHQASANATLWWRKHDPLLLPIMLPQPTKPTTSCLGSGLPLS